jgi:hypothetical protein
MKPIQTLLGQLKTKRILSLVVSVALAYFFYLLGSINSGGKRLIVNQPEYNHLVYIDTCRIVGDTTGKTIAIWYDDYLYTPDSVLFEFMINN